MKHRDFVWNAGIILFIVFSCSAEEIRLDESHGLNISVHNVLESTVDIVSALRKSFGSSLTPDYFFRFLGNLVQGVPLEYATLTASSICGVLLSENAIEPDSDVVPQIKDISLQLRTACKIKEFPLEKLSTIVNDIDFDINKKVVIVSSGWLTNANTSNNVLEGLAKAYNCRNDTNFLGIDVGPYIQTLYTWSSLNTQIIGRQIAVALVNLTEIVPLENFHLMGHSLGAQIVGEIARHYTSLTGKKIQRVTGFDPAGPCFKYGHKQPTISASDADFVDIIHTNPGIAGQAFATGDADFYVGGYFPIKPGCLDAGCSHARSWQYFMESVYPGNERNFLAKRCDSLYSLEKGLCVGEEHPMGYALTSAVKGLFILDVNAKEPYGKNASSNYMNPDDKCGKCEN